MRDDLNASEKRLIAALDRIDHFLDRAALTRAADMPAAALPSGVEEELQQARAENLRLSQELVLLNERQAAVIEDCETRLSGAQARLHSSGQEAARLAVANEALVAANRKLLAGAGLAPDDARRALEAEIESLRAARAAEIAQMAEIVDALDRMIGTAAAPAPEAPQEAGPAGEAVAEGPDEGAGDLTGDETAASAPEPAPAVMLETPPMPRALAERAADEDADGELQGGDEERG